MWLAPKESQIACVEIRWFNVSPIEWKQVLYPVRLSSIILVVIYVFLTLRGCLALTI